MRLSPTRLLFVVVIAALWLSVVWSEGTRALLGRHLHLVFTPSYEYDDGDLDETRAEDRVVSVWQGKNHKSLLEHYPRDVAFLAACVRRYVGTSPNSIRQRQDGPLTSSMPSWSVISPDYQGVPAVFPSDGEMASTPTPQPTPLPDESRYYLSLIKRGQKLEPQNTFWDWMEMVVLIATHRDAEVDAVLKRASHKNDFNDHTSDDLQASIVVSSRHSLDADAKTMAMGAVSYTHVSPMYDATRFLAQRTMGLRLQGRDKDALQYGLRAMRLARLVRLRAAMPFVSGYGKGYELIIMRNARVPFRLAPFGLLALPRNSSLTTLANSPDSLLFLARSHSPATTREIATEWQRLGKWDVGMGSFSGLMPYRTIEALGWTQRATLYLLMSLPLALLFWVLAGLLHRRTGTETVICLSSWWGVVGGIAWLSVLILCEYVPWKIYASDYYEGVLMLFNSWVRLPRVLWGGAVVWLLWLAAWRKTSPLKPRPQRRIEDWEQATVESLPFQMLERITNVARWLGIRGLPLLIFMGIAGAMGFFFLVWQGEYLVEVDYPIVGVHVALLLASVVPMTLVVVGLPARVTRSRDLWARFFGRSHALLTGYVVASLLVLPILLWANSRFERDFNREFAPIENGQMVAAIRQKHGLPMQ